MDIQPISVFLDEAEGVAKLAAELWEPAQDGSRPALSAVQRRLGPDIVDDLERLTAACRTVHARVLYPRDLTVERSRNLARAQELLAEIGAATEFVLDDDQEAPDALARLEAQARGSADSTFATFVQTLFDLATLASELRPRFAELEDFDTRLIDEALALASSLSQNGLAQVGVPASKDVALRDRLLSLLHAKVSRVRLAVAYVFRKHPEIVRKVTSVHERTHRTELRRRKQAHV